MATDHVIIDLTGCIKCLHCKAEAKINMPMLVNDMVAMSRAFIDNHRDCEKRDEI